MTLTLLEDLDVPIIPVACDGQGPLPDALREALKEKPVAFLFQPRVHSVTGSSMTAERLKALGDVLKAATSRPADRLGQSTLGRVSAGAVADLVLLEGDPTERVDAYRRVISVYLGGRKLDTAHLTDTSPGPWHPGVR